MHKKNLEKILNYFSNIEDDDKAESFDKFCTNLEELLGEDKSFYKLTSIIFKNEFNKNIEDNNFKKIITTIIINNNEYILNNYHLLKIILDFDIRRYQIRDNLDRIKDDESLLRIINSNCNNEYLEQSIFNAYDYLFMIYFNDNSILSALSVNILDDCLKFLDKLDYKRDKNIDLAKLYSISYIKSYLGLLVDFSLTEEQEIGDIINLINNEDNAFRKVIKIYIIKILFNSKYVDKNFYKLFNVNFLQKGYNFINKLLEDENNIENIKEILEEKYSPDNSKYKDYPDFKYFVYTISKKDESESFKKQIKVQKDYMNKFPLIFKYLEETESKEQKFKILNYVEKYNEFCNFMIDNYSFKISREEAKRVSLYDQPIIRRIMNRARRNLIENFFDAWEEIGPKAIQYKSNKKMEPKNLTYGDRLAYFLNDINESGYGMYIAAGYEYLIKVQNEFINFILEHGKDKSYLQLYFENLKKKIPIYEANNNQILLIDDIYRISEYKSFTDLVNTFTKRKIFKYNGNIDYSHYNEFEFDFKAIEEELAKLILTGKCLFEDEDHLNFICYWGEGFITGKSNFLEKFEEKYNTEDLTGDEESKIKEYININFNREDPEELKKIYSYLQLLIFHLINFNFNEEEEIIQIIENMDDNITFNDYILRGIFIANGINLKVKKIISVFLFLEYLCFNLFSDNIKDYYKEDIDENIKKKIWELFKNGKNNNDELKALAVSVRRFISRYLYRINNHDEFPPEMKLIIQLKRYDLWNKKFRKIEKIEQILDLINEFNLTIGQSYKFYELIREIDVYNEYKEQEDKMYVEEEIKPKKKPRKKRKIAQ